MKKLLLIIALTLALQSCHKLQKMQVIFIPTDIVIAHRGTTFWAPEETEDAYVWAREAGAHYLEADIQRTKDGVLIALHDDVLTRTTNIATIYPRRKQLSSASFTYKELLDLDAGSWFYQKKEPKKSETFYANNPLKKVNNKAFFFDKSGTKQITQFDAVYTGGFQQILALEDLIRIAEAYRLAKDANGRRLFKIIEKDGIRKYRFYYVEGESSSNRPGVYLETKEPDLFPRIEKDLFDELQRLGWNQLSHPSADTNVYASGYVNVGNTSARVILQTFSPNSLAKLNKAFKGEVPITFLLWLGDDNMPTDNRKTYLSNLIYAKENGAHIIGPSIAGPPNNYADLLTDSHHSLIREEGFLIHPYSFDTEQQMKKYAPKSDGMFSNRAELSLAYYTNRMSK
jgi:glycerophosphoryl diester phosphodiesterase